MHYTGEKSGRVYASGSIASELVGDRGVERSCRRRGERVLELALEGRGSEREDAKEMRRVGHVYLTIAHQLEVFAKRCDTYILDIDKQMERRYQQDEKAFENLLAAYLPIRPGAEMGRVADQIHLRGEIRSLLLGTP